LVGLCDNRYELPARILIDQLLQDVVGGEPFAEGQAAFRALTEVLGLRLAAPEAEALSMAPFVELLLDVRLELRKAKQWAMADKIRDDLKALGVLIEDTPQGSQWRIGNGA
jgi:cysteinyl-tRNA synthetase